MKVYTVTVNRPSHILRTIWGWQSWNQMSKVGACKRDPINFAIWGHFRAIKICLWFALKANYFWMACPKEKIVPIFVILEYVAFQKGKYFSCDIFLSKVIYIFLFLKISIPHRKFSPGLTKSWITLDRIAAQKIYWPFWKAFALRIPKLGPSFLWH